MGKNRKKSRLKKTPSKKFPKYILFRMVLIAAGVSAGFFFLAQGFEHFQGERFFKKRFETFEVGDTRHVVVGLLGEPDTAADEYALDEEGFREAYLIGKHRGSKEYLFWYRGDSVFVVGLDAAGGLTVAVSGPRF